VRTATVHWIEAVYNRRRRHSAIDMLSPVEYEERYWDRRAAAYICYELPWSHLEFKTQLFVKLEPRHVAHKVGLLEHYESQLRLKRRYFEEDYVRSLATMRGGQTDAL